MKTELELRHLRAFLAVVETGGHTRAARSLGVSQSTVSETLISLERALGTELFRKAAKGKGVALTRSGEALLPHARRIMAMTGELAAELAGVTTEVKATLVVAAVESISTYVLPPRLAALREKWPGVRLEVVTRVCADIRESVAAGQSDLGLVLEVDGGAGGSDDSVLTTARLVILGAPSHPLAGRKASPDELRRCDFYMSDAAGDYHQALRRHFDAAGVPQPRTQALGTVEGVKRGILAGGARRDQPGALGLLPAHAVKQELAAGALAEVRVSPPLPGLVLRAVLGPGSESPDSPLVEQLLRGLRGLALG